MNFSFFLAYSALVILDPPLVRCDETVSVVEIQSYLVVVLTSTPVAELARQALADWPLVRLDSRFDTTAVAWHTVSDQLLFDLVVLLGVAALLADVALDTIPRVLLHRLPLVAADALLLELTVVYSNV